MQLLVCPWEISGGTSGGSVSRCLARIILTWISFHSNPPPGGGHLFGAICVSLCVSVCVRVHIHSHWAVHADIHVGYVCVFVGLHANTFWCVCAGVFSDYSNSSDSHWPRKITQLTSCIDTYRCMEMTIYLYIIYVLANKNTVFWI